MENALTLNNAQRELYWQFHFLKIKIGKKLRQWSWLTVLAVWMLYLKSGDTGAHAATPIPVISYQASTGVPTTPWTGGASATYSTTVTRTIINDGGREVLRVYDPGTARDDVSTPKVAANRSFSYTVSADQHLASITQGWVMKITMKLPTIEDAALDPTIASGAWGVDSNHWVGYYFDSMVPDEGGYVRGTERYLYALMFGRAEDGRTIVRPYNLSSTYDKYLSPDYHEYAIVYQNGSAKIYIDGEFWMDYSAYVNTPDAGATRYMYWGDNNSQGSAIKARSTYYESFSFEIIPEPSKALLMMMAAIPLLFQSSRRRKK